MSDTDDETGAAAIDRHSAAILERLFRTEVPRLVRFVRRRIGRHDDAHDLVQEAFLRFAGARPSSLTGKPEAYLQRILRNLLINRSKRADVRLADRHVAIEEAHRLATPPEQGLALEADDVLQRYKAALEQLPSRTQEVFLLHRVDELSYTEIATRLGVSVKTVEYHIGKALAHLNKALNGE